MPALTGAVKELTGILKASTAIAREHPTAVQLIGGGALALTSAGFKAMGAVLGVSGAGGIVPALTAAASTIGRLFLPLAAVAGTAQVGRLGFALKSWWDVSGRPIIPSCGKSMSAWGRLHIVLRYSRCVILFGAADTISSGTTIGLNPSLQSRYQA